MLGTIGKLTVLRTLSLRLNALSGGIPADIGSCTELRYLPGQPPRWVDTGGVLRPPVAAAARPLEQPLRRWGLAGLQQAPEAC